MKPGMELLLALLRGEPIATQPSAQAWQLTLDLAEHEGVLPSCVAAIRRAGAPLPEPVSVSLAAIDRELAISSFWWTSELSGILSAFHQGSSPLILLKGPLLAKRLYGDVHLRTSRDLDLLVRASDLRAARALLTKLGFTADLRPDDYHQSWRRGTTLLELHHNVENPLAYRLDMNSMWARSLEVEFCGYPVRHFAPLDEILYLCLHGVRHRFERLSHVLDLLFAFEVLSPQANAADMATLTAAAMRPLVVLGHAMAVKLHPQLPGLPFAISREELAHLDAVADHRWHALMQQHSGSPLDWHEQHLFYLELESTRWRRLLRSSRHLLILATRLIQPDFDFAARYHVKQPMLVWVIRQLRLLTRSSGIVRNQSS